MRHSDTSASLKIEFVRSPEKLTALFYDLDKRELDRDLTDYALAMTEEEMLDPSTVEGRSYNIGRLWQLLRRKGQSPDDVTDRLIKQFRKEELTAVQAAATSKGSLRAAKSTVNERLRCCYRWLLWLQMSSRVRGTLIGPTRCSVRSTLQLPQFEPEENRQLRWRGRTGRTDYPTLFRQVGTGSKHGVSKAPSEDMRFELLEQLHSSASSRFLAHRNVLIVDIANTVGFRRGSINSLRISQFVAQEISASDTSHMYVTPASQKLDYEDEYELPMHLMSRVRSFIDNYLIPTAKDRGWAGFDEKNSRIFVSDKTGKPLADRSITTLLSKHLRAVGGKRGMSTHSFRHKFVHDEIDSELEYRRAEGLDQTTESILSSVRSRIGHKHDASIRAYIESNVPQDRKDRSAVLAKRIADAEGLALELKDKARTVHRLVQDLLQRAQGESPLTTEQFIEQLREVAAALKVSDAAATG